MRGFDRMAQRHDDFRAPRIVGQNVPQGRARIKVKAGRLSRQPRPGPAPLQKPLIGFAVADRALDFEVVAKKFGSLRRGMKTLGCCERY